MQTQKIAQTIDTQPRYTAESSQINQNNQELIKILDELKRVAAQNQITTLEQIKKTDKVPPSRYEYDTGRMDISHYERFYKTYKTLKLGLEPSIQAAKIHPALSLPVGLLWSQSFHYPAKYGYYDKMISYKILSKLLHVPESALATTVLAHYLAQKSPDVLKSIYERHRARLTYGNTLPIREHLYQGYRLLSDFMKIPYIPMMNLMGAGLGIYGMQHLLPLYLSGVSHLPAPLRLGLLPTTLPLHVLSLASHLVPSSLLTTAGAYAGKYLNPFRTIYPFLGKITGVNAIAQGMAPFAAKIPLFGGLLSSALMHPALPFLGTYMAFSMGISIARASAMRKYRTRDVNAYEIEQKTSASYQLTPFLYRIITTSKNIDPLQVLQLQTLMLIEQHTSIVPLIYNLLHGSQQIKHVGSEKGRDIIYGKQIEPEDIYWFEKPQKFLEKLRIKYDPFTQLLNFILTGKTPKQFINEILYREEKRNTERNLYAKKYGISYNAVSLLGTNALYLISQAKTYEEKVIALLAGIYDLNRAQLTELITIRKFGFGIQEATKIKLHEPFQKSITNVIGDLVKGFAKTNFKLWEGIYAVIRRDEKRKKNVSEYFKRGFKKAFEEAPFISAIYNYGKLMKGLTYDVIKGIQKKGKKEYARDVYSKLRDFIEEKAFTKVEPYHVKGKFAQKNQLKILIDIRDVLFAIYKHLTGKVFRREIKRPKRIAEDLKLVTFRKKPTFVVKKEKPKIIRKIESFLKKRNITPFEDKLQRKTFDVYRSTFKDMFKDFVNITKQNVKEVVREIIQLYMEDYERLRQKIPKFAEGGEVPGKDDGKDKVLSLLRPGEFVLSHKHLAKLGKLFIKEKTKKATISTLSSELAEEAAEIEKQKLWKWRNKLLEYVSSIYKFLTKTNISNIKSEDKSSDSLLGLGLLSSGIIFGKKLVGKLASIVFKKMIKPFFIFFIEKVIPASIKNFASDMMGKLGSGFIGKILGKILTKGVAKIGLRALPFGIGAALAEGLTGGNIIDIVGAGLGGAIGGAIGLVGGPIGEFFGSIIGAEIGKWLFNKIYNFMLFVPGYIKDKAKSVLKWFKKKIKNFKLNKIINIILKPFEYVLSLPIKMFKAIKAGISKMFKGFIWLLKKIPGIGIILDKLGIKTKETTKNTTNTKREVSKTTRQPSKTVRQRTSNVLTKAEYLDILTDSLLMTQRQIESNYDPFAVSEAGAVGIAQFMPATWEYIWKNKDIFSKFNPELSKYKGIPSIYNVEAQKAAQKAYMAYLFNKFGSIQWALAAYNWGEGNVKRLYEKYHGNFSLAYTHLPKETQKYVEKILHYDYKTLTTTGVFEKAKTTTKSISSRTEDLFESLTGKIENKAEKREETKTEQQATAGTQQAQQVNTVPFPSAIEIFDTKTIAFINKLFDNVEIKFEEYIYDNVFDVYN